MSRFSRKVKRTPREQRPLNLSNALVCVDCEHIFSSYNPTRSCPKCGSEAVTFLSRWIPSLNTPRPRRVPTALGQLPAHPALALAMNPVAVEVL